MPKPSKFLGEVASSISSTCRKKDHTLTRTIRVPIGQQYHQLKIVSMFNIIIYKVNTIISANLNSNLVRQVRAAIPTIGSPQISTQPKFPSN
jgi:hypothetical protein